MRHVLALDGALTRGNELALIAAGELRAMLAHLRGKLIVERDAVE